MDRRAPPGSYFFPHPIRIRVREFSKWDEFETWWILKADLTLDLITYYVICSAFGFLSGLQIGSLMVGLI
jgi:hypothetical protein